MDVPGDEVTASALEVFGQVCELDADSRAAFFEAHDTDPRVRAEVESLLLADAGTALPDETPGQWLTGLEVEVPERLGDFELVEVIGRGGMGTVWRGRQERPAREVAVKVLDRRFLPDAALRRFELEVELLGRLEHPGIAQIHAAGIGREGEPPWFAMELVDGPPLLDFARRLDRRGRLELFLRICEAVDHAHQHGVIHRDLKSANVLVAKDGQPKVLDFGVARGADPEGPAETALTLDGHVVGTLLTMSPEQARGDLRAIGTRSDVYALGVVLHQLLTDRAPLELGGIPVTDALRRIAEDVPARVSTTVPELAGDLDVIVGKALEKDPRERYASAGALADDLRRHLEHRPILAAPPGAVDRAVRFARRNPLPVGGAAAIATILIAATAVSLSYWRDAEAEREVAEGERRAAELERDRLAQLYGFLRGTLGGLDPNRARGEEPTVRAMVDEAAAELAAAPPADPDLRASMHALLGDIYERIAVTDAAQHHLSAALALVDGSAGAELDGPTLARVVGALGDLALFRIDEVRADAMFTRLLELVESDPSVARGQRAVALRGRAQLPSLPVEQRLEAIDGAIAAAEESDRSGIHGLRALRATLLTMLGRVDEATASLEALAAQARELERPSDELDALSELANLLAQQGDPRGLTHLERVIELLDGTLGRERSHGHVVSIARCWQRATGQVPELALARLAHAPTDLSALRSGEVGAHTWCDLAHLCRATGDQEGLQACLEAGLPPLEAAREREGNGLDPLRTRLLAELLGLRAALALDEGRFEAARDDALRSVELREGPDAPTSQTVVVATAYGRGLEAAAEAARAEVERARARGWDYVAGQVEMTLGTLQWNANEDREQAVETLRRGLELCADVDLESDPNLASMHLVVGGYLVDTGRYSDAIAALEPLAELPAALGAESEAPALSRLGSAYFGLAAAETDRALLARALEFHERAFEVGRTRHPEDGAALAKYLNNVASTLLAAGDAAEAATRYDEALELLGDRDPGLRTILLEDRAMARSMLER